MKDSGGENNYTMTITLANTAPHGDSVSNCTGHSRYVGSTGILEIPAVDVTDPFGAIVTYTATMQLKPLNEKVMFELLDVSVK